MEEDEIDKEDMKGFLKEFSQHCREATKIARNIKITEKIDNIIVTGMGGSAISGNLLKAYFPELNITVNRDYYLPSVAGRKTLVFVISYSGNTEETVSAYREAIKQGSHIIAISSGGKLEKLAKDDSKTHVKVPEGIQPRLATSYLFFPMVTILQNSGIVKDKSREIDKMIVNLKKPAFMSMAEDLVNKMENKIPIVYASERYRAVAMKWKTDINENAKIHAFYNIYPEFNHNEINGYVNKIGEFYVIIIKDDEDYFRIKRRMTITRGLIKNKGVNVTEISIRGDSFLTKLFSAMYIGMWVSYFLALKYETDPTPVKIIEDLKKQLK